MAQKVAILGYDTDGKSSYEYYAKLGANITICDRKTDLDTPPGVATQLGKDYLANLDSFDVLVRTSGMPPSVIAQANPDVTERVTTQINEFLRVCPTRNIIGVTGTKGKGTTSTLIAKMLEAAGKHVEIGGNIGVPPLGFVDTLHEDSWVVLELSSFQLIDLKLAPHIAVCLMVVPEHLNWHTDMAEYIAAKSRLFECQTSNDIAIYYAENALSHDIAHAGAGRKVPYYTSPGAWVNGDAVTIDGLEVCATSEIKLLGKHHWQNVCAAITAVWQAGVHDIAAIRSVVTSFSGLEHRLDFVREHNGVRYYDDSFGTTPETAIVAIQAFTEPKVIILGGSDKGASYDELAHTVATSNVRRAILIGEQAARIQQSLEKAGFHKFSQGGNTMPEIVSAAHATAKNGDIVLLSPACASFGLFADYKDRGNQFKQAVLAL